MRALFLTCLLVFSTAQAQTRPQQSAVLDWFFVGGGIMSATLATLLKQVDPSLTMEIHEKGLELGGESSDTFNNAGTGHSNLCEVNYTPMKENGEIDTSKGEQIMEAFESTLQFLASLVHTGAIKDPQAVINSVVHGTFVKGREDVEFLEKRYNALIKNHLFAHMEFTKDVKTMRKWMPVVMEGQDPSVPMAATRSFLGTDIDFGRLTRLLGQNLAENHLVPVRVQHKVLGLRKGADGIWRIKVRDLVNKKTRIVKSRRVFVGAGGYALDMLKQADPELLDGYAGFPISGQFLISTNTELAERHSAKIYGKAPVGAPPMSVPHLDTRVVNGNKVLMFGPFAGATTSFAKQGSIFDLFKSVHADNFFTMVRGGIRNIPLVGYLIEQASQSHEDRMRALREFIPGADPDEWHLEAAGQRVQIMKNDPDPEKIIRLGTEVVISKDGTLVGLMGASPGASVAFSEMAKVVEHVYSAQADLSWRDKIRAMVPSYGLSLKDNQALAESTRKWSRMVLRLFGGHDCEATLTEAEPPGS